MKSIEAVCRTINKKLLIGASEQDRLSRLLCLSGSAFVLIYSIFKAYYSAFTTDEAYSYFFYARSFGAAFANDPPFPNNHLLNSLLMRLSSLLFGTSELALRIPNLAALLLYLLACWRLVGKSSRNWGLYLALIFSPMLLSYFALARGYGLSLGCLALALVFLERFWVCAENRSLNAALCFLFGWLAVLANLTILNVLLPLYALFALGLFWLVLRERRTFMDRVFRFRPAVIPLFLGAGCSVYILYIIRLYAEKKQFYYGGTVGFWQDTVLSLVVESAGKVELLIASANTVSLLLGIFYLLSFCLALRSLFVSKFNPKNLGVFLLFNGLLLSAAGISVIQVYILDSRYLIGRTAIFLAPLFVTAFYKNIGLVDPDKLFGCLPKLGQGLALVLVLICVLSVDLSPHSEWYCAESVRTGAEQLAKRVRGKSGRKKTVLLHWKWREVFQYYSERLELDSKIALTINTEDRARYILTGDIDSNKLPKEKVKEISQLPPCDFKLLRTAK